MTYLELKKPLIRLNGVFVILKNPPMIKIKILKIKLKSIYLTLRTCRACYLYHWVYRQKKIREERGGGRLSQNPKIKKSKN